MLTDQQRSDTPEEVERARRVAARYRETAHYRKWGRLERHQAFKFKAIVASTKVFFDCLGMVAFSATIFGLAVAAHTSQPADEFCERPLSWAFVALALLGLTTGMMAFRPIGYWATMMVASFQKAHLAPFHPRVVGRQRSGMIVVRIGLLVAYVWVFTLAYAVGEHLVSRKSATECSVAV